MTGHGTLSRLKELADKESPDHELATLKKLVLFVEREVHLLGGNVEVPTTALLDALHEINTNRTGADR